MTDENTTSDDTAAKANEGKEEAAKDSPAETPAPEKKEAAPAPAKEEKVPPKKEEPKADLPELSKDAAKILEMVEKLSVLELAALVKNMEDKFGVSAAAPVAVAAIGGAAGSGDGDDAGAVKDSYDVILTSAGQAKINVIKAVREITGLGLKEAKDLVDAAPKPVKEGVKENEANDIKKKLEEAGAEVELK